MAKSTLAETLRRFREEAKCGDRAAGMLVIAEALWGVATAIDKLDTKAEETTQEPPPE